MMLSLTQGRAEWPRKKRSQSARSQPRSIRLDVQKRTRRRPRSLGRQPNPGLALASSGSPSKQDVPSWRCCVWPRARRLLPSCRVYLGEVHHGGKWFNGEHEAIVDEQTLHGAARPKAQGRFCHASSGQRDRRHRLGSRSKAFQPDRSPWRCRCSPATCGTITTSAPSDSSMRARCGLFPADMVTISG